MISFDDAYGWLNKFDGGESYLGETLRQLVRRMKSAWDVQDTVMVFHYIELLQHVGMSLIDPGNIVEGGELHVECGWAYYKMGDYMRAEEEFHQAILLYNSGRGHLHNNAVSDWLQGAVFWRMARQSEAVASWSNSRRIFEYLAYTTGHTQWYRKQVTAMQETLDAAIDAGRWPLNP